MTRHFPVRFVIPVLAFLTYGCAREVDVREGDAAAVAPGSQTVTDPRVQTADLNRIQGDSSAKVWLIMVSDFQCPACKNWHETQAEPILREYVATGRVRFAYINFPLSQHLNAVPASEAAMCAGAQGKFWPVHDRIFAHQAEWSNLPDPTAHFRQLAGEAGVDTVAWNQCVTEDIMLPLIDGDRSRGDNSGVGQTPTFFIGTRVVSGGIPAVALRPILDSAIAQAGGSNR